MRSEKFEEIRLQAAKLKQGFFEAAKKGTRRN